MAINERRDVKDVAHHADFVRLSDGGSTARICLFERRKSVGVILS
jgi:hypothetical protein